MGKRAPLYALEDGIEVDGTFYGYANQLAEDVSTEKVAELLKAKKFSYDNPLDFKR